MRRWQATLAWAIAAVLALAALLAMAAPRWNLPWRAERVLELAPADADVRFAEARREGDGASLLLRGAAGDGSSLVSWREVLAPADYRFLTVDFPGYPRELRLALTWRTAAEPDRLRMARLPWPGGRTTVDLGRLDAFDEPIVALGLAQLPADLLPAEAARERELAFAGARLESDARLPALAALLDEWTALRPWHGRSINTGGFETGYAQPVGMTPWLLLVAVLAAGAAWYTPSLRRHRRWLLLAPLAGAWLLLDLRQLAEMNARRQQLDAMRERAGERPLSVAPGLDAALDALAARLPDGARVLLLSDSPFVRAWGPLALAPRNVAAPPPGSVREIAPGTVALRMGAAGDVDAASGTWRIGDRRYRVRPLPAGGDERVLEVLGLDGEGA